MHEPCSWNSHALPLHPFAIPIRITGVGFLFAYLQFFWSLTLNCLSSTIDLFIADIQERAESALRAHSSSVRGSLTQAQIPEDSVPKTGKLPAFIKEEVLVRIYNVCILFVYLLDLVFYLNFFFFFISTMERNKRFLF